MWPGGVLAGLAALLALAFAVTGRNGRRVMWVAALAIVLSGLAFLIGAV
jgi:heme A synthase